MASSKFYIRMVSTAIKSTTKNIFHTCKNASLGYMLYLGVPKRFDAVSGVHVRPSKILSPLLYCKDHSINVVGLISSTTFRKSILQSYTSCSFVFIVTSNSFKIALILSYNFGFPSNFSLKSYSQ